MIIKIKKYLDYKNNIDIYQNDCSNVTKKKKEIMIIRSRILSSYIWKNARKITLSLC